MRPDRVFVGATSADELAAGGGLTGIVSLALG
jgi:hypothetical protein